MITSERGQLIDKTEVTMVHKKTPVNKRTFKNTEAALW